MSELWQYIGVGLAVLAAAIYLTVYFIRRRQTRGGCSACRLMQAAQEQPSKKPSSSSNPTAD